MSIIMIIRFVPYSRSSFYVKYKSYGNEEEWSVIIGLVLLIGSNDREPVESEQKSRTGKVGNNQNHTNRHDTRGTYG